MSSLLLFLSTHALAFPLDLDREIAHRELILHGLVGKQQQCLSADGRDAFTFLELLPLTSLLGPLPSSSFWIQRLGGTFPDGSIAAPYGLPLLSPGEEVVILLDYSEDGSPDLLSDPSDGLYRVFALDPADGLDGATAVVDGGGFLLLQGSEGLRRGPLLDGAAADLPFGEPIDYAHLREQVLALSDRLDPPLASEPWPGAWTGALRLSVEEEGRELVCSATLFGEALPTGELYLDGRCNLPYIGAASLGLEAVYTVGGWSGNLSVFPDDERWEGRSHPLAGEGGQDRLSASILSSEVQGGRLLSGSAELLAGFSGLLPPATREDLIAALDASITRTGATGGPARSAKISPQTCFSSIHPLPLSAE